MITGSPVRTQGDIDTLPQHFHYWSDTVTEHHVTDRIMRYRAAGLLQYSDFFCGDVNRVSEDRVIPRNAEAMQKLHHPVSTMFVLHAVHHRPGLSDMRAYTKPRRVRESANFFEQRRRRVDWRRVGAGHKAELLILFMARQHRFNSTECSFRCLARA